MIGDNDNNDDTDLDDEILDDDDDDMSDDVMPDIGGDTLIDVTGELQAEVLATSLSKDDPDEIAHRREVRRRLDELAEKRNQDLDSTFNIDLNDDD